MRSLRPCTFPGLAVPSRAVGHLYAATAFLLQIPIKVSPESLSQKISRDIQEEMSPVGVLMASICSGSPQQTLVQKWLFFQVKWIKEVTDFFLISQDVLLLLRNPNSNFFVLFCFIFVFRDKSFSM